MVRVAVPRGMREESGEIPPEDDLHLGKTAGLAWSLDLPPTDSGGDGGERR